MTLELLALFETRTVFWYRRKSSFRSDDRSWSNVIVTQSSKFAHSRYLGQTCKSRKSSLWACLRVLHSLTEVCVVLVLLWSEGATFIESLLVYFSVILSKLLWSLGNFKSSITRYEWFHSLVWYCVENFLVLKSACFPRLLVSVLEKKPHYSSLACHSWGYRTAYAFGSASVLHGESWPVNSFLLVTFFHTWYVVIFFRCIFSRWWFWSLFWSLRGRLKLHSIFGFVCRSFPNNGIFCLLGSLLSLQTQYRVAFLQ